MEDFELRRERARDLIRIADHMLIITYPLVKDPKLLVAVTEKMFDALENSMSSLLYFERMHKRIGPFNETFDSKFNVFRSEIVPKFNIDREFIRFFQEIREIIRDHMKSPVEFARKEKFVICSDNYQIRSLSYDTIKRHIAKAKSFIQQMELLVIKNERISE